MFKWICLGVATVFLSAGIWMLNDMRGEVRRSAQLLQHNGQVVNEHLPAIVERTRKTTGTISENLPVIVEKTKLTTETLADLAADVQQFKELAGMTSTERDKNLVAYANGVIKQIEQSGGTIGLKKHFGGKGLKNTQPAAEWAAGARKGALWLTIRARSKKDLVTRLAKNKFGSDWYIQTAGQEPVPLLDWLRASHPHTRELFEKS
jgi:hypothetical protein